MHARRLCCGIRRSGALVAVFGVAGAACATVSPSGPLARASAIATSGAEQGPGLTPPPPIAPPAPGRRGCVESDALKRYVLELEARRRGARDAALRAAGAEWQERQSAFAPAAGAHVGAVRLVGDERFAVLAALAVETAPRLALARTRDSVRRLDERPRAHAVPLVVCGVRSCPRPAPPPLPVRPVAVALAPGETLGAPLTLSYDFWWTSVTYSEERRCAR